MLPHRIHDSPRLVWLDAPFVLSPADLAETFSSPADLDAAEAEEDTDPAMRPRGWWKVDTKRTRTDGIEQSFELIRDVLKKDHYDVSLRLVSVPSSRSILIVMCGAQGILGFRCDCPTDIWTNGDS